MKFILLNIVAFSFFNLAFSGQSYSQASKQALMTKRKEILLKMDLLIKANKECLDNAAHIKDESLRKYSEEFLKTEKGKKIKEDILSSFNWSQEECGKKWFERLRPIQDELLANTAKIQELGGLDSSNENSNDPVSISRSPKLQSIDFTSGTLTPVEKNNKDKCENLRVLRDVILPGFFDKTLEEYKILDEHKKELKLLINEVESDKWKFGVEAEAGYMVAQTAKTTAKLIANIAAIVNVEVIPVADVMKRLMGKLEEGDNDPKAVRDAAFDKVCAIISNKTTTLGRSAIAICDLVNDIQKLPYIKKKNSEMQIILSAQLKMLDKELDKYNQLLEDKKSSVDNIVELTKVIDDYGKKYCKQN